MTDFTRGITPKEIDEVVDYLDELGFRLEETFLDLGNFTNVDLTSTVPVEGTTLVYDAAAARWVAGAGASATTVELNDITSTVNTSASKKLGTMVFNSTAGRPVWALGDTDGSVWVDATGATVHTPV